MSYLAVIMDPMSPRLSDALDARINRLAAQSHGAVTTGQLLAEGVDRRSVARRVAAGQLRADNRRGAFVVPTHADEWTGVALAQLRSPLLIASGRTAAAMWSMDGFDRPDMAIVDFPDLLAPDRTGLRGRGIVRTDELTADEITTRYGLTVTTPARTLAELGRYTDDFDLLERALEYCLRPRRGGRLITMTELDDWLGTHVGRKQPAQVVLKSVLDRRGRALPPTDSDAETLFVQLVRRAGLDGPRRQVPVVELPGARPAAINGPAERVDFLFDGGDHSRALVVEIDGAKVHTGAGPLQHDLNRQNRLLDADVALARFTWADVTQHPNSTLRTLRRKLADNAGTADHPARTA